MRPKNAFVNVTPTIDTITSIQKNHRRILSGNIQIGNSNSDPSKNITNFRATGATPGVANTDFTITHTLGYIPDTILTQDTDNGGVLYRSPVTAWTKTTVTLRCTTVTANYKVRVA